MLNPWKCVDVLHQSFVQCTIEQSSAYSKHDHCPFRLNPVPGDQVSDSEKKVLGRDSTSFDVLGIGCQYQERL